MPNIDLSARLSLNGAAFDASVSRSFASMKSQAASAGNEVKNAFTSSFAEVQRLASKALTMPRTAGGSLDLSGEINSLRSAATLAEQYSVAQQELAAAYRATAAASNADTTALEDNARAALLAAAA